MIVKKPENDTEILQKKLQKIKDQKGILGYIIIDQKSASVDLKNPTKINDYAMFSSTAHEVSQDITEPLQVGDVDTIVIESEETKLLSMNIKGHRLNLFMERNVDEDKLQRKLT
jgi:predicted regulator of Ras-like GTPase activity (Roadblock/LC7/MglB family)